MTLEELIGLLGVLLAPSLVTALIMWSTYKGDRS